MKRCNVGGQAVMEGIMMKGPASYALAVRKPDQEIALTVTDYVSFTQKHKVLNIPIVRGVVNFVESLYIGTKTLMDSAAYFEDEEEEAVSKNNIDTENPETTKANTVEVDTVRSETAKTDVKKTGISAEDKGKTDDADQKKSDKGFLIGTLLFSLVLAIGVFVVLPSFLANFLYHVTDSHFLVNLAEGVLRLIIFLVYIWAISKMEEIHRTFMYHGAEHKTINCLEAGDDLTPENVLRHTRFHKRCGTSFVFIVMFISILVFMFIKTDVIWLRLLSRVLLIPVIAGISYEFIRYAGRHENAFANILSQPGLWVQRLTTKEPTIDMAEVAIKSVEAVIDVEEYLHCIRDNCFE